MKQPKKVTLNETEKSKTTASQTAENPELFMLLKELRKKIAATQSVPAYVVFPDTALREMSVKQPVTIDEFMKISGVGEKKAARYGKKFMQVIADYKKQKQQG